MLNSVNTFNNAKARNDTELLRKFNMLIDILQQQIKMLSASIANGITVNTVGEVSLGAASSTAAGALTSTDWTTFNNKCSKEEAVAYAIALGGIP